MLAIPMDRRYIYLINCYNAILKIKYHSIANVYNDQVTQFTAPVVPVNESAQPVRRGFQHLVHAKLNGGGLKQTYSNKADDYSESWDIVQY